MFGHRALNLGKLWKTTSRAFFLNDSGMDGASAYFFAVDAVTEPTVLFETQSKNRSVLPLPVVQSARMVVFFSVLRSAASGVRFESFALAPSNFASTTDAPSAHLVLLFGSKLFRAR
jgi:hypothetical protein